jgi:hypothetical protein
MRSLLARSWALAGLVLLLGRASVSLTLKGYHEVVAPGLLTPVEWMALAGIALLFVWGEGWMALHRKWAPRVAGRIRDLDAELGALGLVLAPLHAVGLVGAPRRTLVRTWSGVAAIVVAVVLVRQLAQPWQGMIKLGVAGALALGVVSLTVRVLDGGLRSSDFHSHAESIR